MKFYFILGCILLVSLNVHAQKEYNTWYFGDKAGITFNINPPSAITNGAMYTLESSSSMCDENGNILFYTNGDTVWNRHHQYMKNNLTSSYFFHSTSSQGSVIVKKPGSDYLYYIFCSRSEPSYSTDYCVRYWLIDMEGDNGAGEVLKMNEPLPLWEPLEGLAITNHANDTDIWIGAINNRTGVFGFIRTVNGELDDKVESTDLGISCYPYFCSKFSPNAQILLSNRNIVTVTEPNSLIFKSVIYLHHFNNETGQLSNQLEIEAYADDYWTVNMAVEFSHNSRYLYLGTSAGELIQYDLSVWDKKMIEESATVIHHNPNSSQEVMGLQLGPDKKIYVCHLYKENLTVIDKPWLKGTSCNVLQNYVNLKGRANQFGAPYYPTYTFKKLWDTESEDYFVPDAFTPNGDNINDVFSISAANLEELSIQIYNRWGEKIYDEQRLDAAWDGTFKGKPCPQDVYVYSITITGKKNGFPKTDQISGNITLLR
jgi:gliding motility-associated-like protein